MTPVKRSVMLASSSPRRNADLLEIYGERPTSRVPVPLKPVLQVRSCPVIHDASQITITPQSARRVAEARRNARQHAAGGNCMQAAGRSHEASTSLRRYLHRGTSSATELLPARD